jgi:hypothetical protein
LVVVGLTEAIMMKATMTMLLYRAQDDDEYDQDNH